MIGRKLTERLSADGHVAGEPIDAIDLVDIVDVPPAGIDVVGTVDTGPVERRSIVADLAEPGAAERLAATEPDVVFHLAGIVSGEAEADLAKGYRVNLDGTRRLFDALAAATGTPRVVFTSSIAVFGAPFPDVIGDEFHLTPLTSYGTQKAIGESLLADYSRRGLIDGVGVRLPTITVRPGKPNAAASGFFSGIIREPLAGMPAFLPVEPTVRHPHASPRSAIGYLVHAAGLDTARLGNRRNLTMPSISVTVQDQIDALGRVAGVGAVDLIERRPDPAVEAIVAGWPERFATSRADELGFVCDPTYDAIIQAYLDDDAPRSR
jgi:nucleoside-diphosphate-sugar epimerase